jgi:hypothetical protein
MLVSWVGGSSKSGKVKAGSGGVVIAGCSAEDAGDVGDGVHKVAEEFGGVVRVEDVRRAAAEMQRVHQTR